MAREPLTRFGIVVLIAAVFGFAIAHDVGSGHDLDLASSATHAVADATLHAASGVCAAAALFALGLLAVRPKRRRRPIAFVPVLAPPERPVRDRRATTRGLLFELCVLRA